MNTEKLTAIIQEAIPDATVEIDSPDDHHFFGRVISASFEGQTLIERQRRVYERLNDLIKSGELHAISLKTKTPDEVASAEK